MHDAKGKEKENDKNKELKFNSIYDRSYYDKNKNENIMATKTSYVPSETLFFE